MKELVDFIEAYEVITPKEAENIAKRSAATVRRYLKMLIYVGCIVAEGNTNNSKYHISTNWNDRVRK